MRTTYHKWSESELNYLQSHYQSSTDEELANSLSQMTGSSITTAMIRRQRKKLSIAKPKGRRKRIGVV
jgi:hypothetical protein